MIRILGGERRGKNLIGPSGLEFRPVTSRVKAYVFSFFHRDMPGASVLDLFSGTGSLGLEAVSRGASYCVHVERNPKAIKLLKRNIGACGFEKRVRIVDGDVFSSLTRLRIQGDAFDFIFADPPFKELLREKIVQTVDRNRVLKKNGFLIVEHGFHDPDSLDHGLQLLKQKRFGDSAVTVYGYTGFAS